MSRKLQNHLEGAIDEAQKLAGETVDASDLQAIDWKGLLGKLLTLFITLAPAILPLLSEKKDPVVN